MQGTVSFHPLDLGFFDELIQPLLAGQKVNPDLYLETALRLHTAEAVVARYRRSLEEALRGLTPPPPPTEGPLWDRIRARLERFDFRPDRWRSWWPGTSTRTCTWRDAPS